MEPFEVSIFMVKLLLQLTKSSEKLKSKLEKSAQSS